MDWFHKRKIVLGSKKLIYTVKKSPPREAPADQRFDGSIHDADIHLHLKELYGESTVKELMTDHMHEGTSVHENGIQLKELFNRLVIFGFELEQIRCELLVAIGDSYAMSFGDRTLVYRREVRSELALRSDVALRSESWYQL
ncbi:hypothetical protein F511_03860 [Dorcoceras hygrometricum]|nr:hypothetical protein F511_03860 [Dorcoceras hygrometricum]